MNRLLLPLLCGMWGFLAVAGEALAWRPLAASRVVALALVITALIEARRAWRAPPPALLLWAAVAPLAWLSLLWSADRPETLRMGQHLLQEVVLLGALAVTPRRRMVVGALVVGLLGGGGALALGFADAFGSGLVRAGRLHLWEGDGNLQARGLALGLIAWIAIRRPGPVGAIGAGLLAMGLALTGSRGAWLATLPALLWLASFPPHRSTRRAALLAVIGFGLGLALLPARPQLRSPLQGVVELDREALTSGRDAIWTNTLAIARDHPLLGVGAGAVPAVYDPYRDALMAGGGAHSKRGQNPHSHYLQLLAELGPLALLIWVIGLLFAAFGGARHAPRVAAPLLIFSALSAATVCTLDQRAWWLSLLLVGLLSAPLGRR